MPGAWNREQDHRAGGLGNAKIGQTNKLPNPGREQRRRNAKWRRGRKSGNPFGKRRRNNKERIRGRREEEYNYPPGHERTPYNTRARAGKMIVKPKRYEDYVSFWTNFCYHRRKQRKSMMNRILKRIKFLLILILCTSSPVKADNNINILGTYTIEFAFVKPVMCS